VHPSRVATASLGVSDATLDVTAASVYLKTSMRLNVSKLRMFKSTTVTRSTYSQYRLNSSVIEELLSEAGQE